VDGQAHRRRNKSNPLELPSTWRIALVRHVDGGGPAGVAPVSAGVAATGALTASLYKT
jgi:hypothetical protein